MSEAFQAEIRRLFDLVLDLPRAERTAVLERECAGDVELEQRVLAILAAAEDESFLGDATLDEQASPVPGAEGWGETHGAESVGDVIGAYKLLEKIGEGGFGSVWMAEQREPVRRRVALKIIKLGMDTKQVIARFEAERQALAMMEHPNIAQVFDAGSTETGRPYFVMEYIKGVPILEFCDAERLDTEARLQLFIRVCQAIQHAHQKGIIHRDIKPSNVLVTLHDGVPVPKVIDFGIAKATHAELTTKTLFTEHRQFIGTPAYMSPEQAEMSGLDIDTRSDVYSLGVLLYELLTGTTPFDMRALLDEGLAEMMRVIREVEPKRPSTRISSLGESSTRTAHQRRVAVESLSSLLKGDLDWIVMKCLEKDRTRRYATANGLADDVARHLAHEAVLASPPSSSYRLRKFYRRNRGPVLVTGAIAGLLIAGIVVLSFLVQWALGEKGRADFEAQQARSSARAEREAKAAAIAEREVAVAAQVRAERELERANEFKGLVSDMFDGVTPEFAQTADTGLLERILGISAQRIESGSIADPLVAAEMHELLGKVYLLLGRFEEAEEHLPESRDLREEHLGADHEETLEARHLVGRLFLDLGELERAEDVHRAVLAQRTARFGADDERVAASRTELGAVLVEQGRYAEALPIFEAQVDWLRRTDGITHRKAPAMILNLATTLWRLQRLEEAELLAEEAATLGLSQLSEHHPDVLAAQNLQGLLLAARGSREAAVRLYEQVLEGQLEVFGDEHPNTWATMNNLAMQYGELGRALEAEQMFVDLIDAGSRSLGEDHPSNLSSRLNLMNLRLQLGRLDPGSLVEYRTLLEALRGADGELASARLGVAANLGFALIDAGRQEDAVEILAPTLDDMRAELGRDHPWTQGTLQELARVYRRLDRFEERLALERERVEFEIDQAKTPGASASLLNALAWKLLTHPLAELHDEPLAVDLAERGLQAEGAQDPARRSALLDTLALAQFRTGDATSALRNQREAIELLAPEDVDESMRERLAEYERAADADR